MPGNAVVHALLMATLFMIKAPDNCHLIGMLRHQRQVFRKLYSRNVSVDRAEFAPQFRKSTWFGIPGFIVTNSTPAVDYYAAFRRHRWCSLQLQHGGDSKPRRGNWAFQEVSTTVINQQQGTRNIGIGILFGILCHSKQNGQWIHCSLSEFGKDSINCKYQ